MLEMAVLRGGRRPAADGIELQAVLSPFMRSRSPPPVPDCVAVGYKTGLWYSDQIMRLNRLRGPNVR
jgi:hypothetical protein